MIIIESLSFALFWSPSLCRMQDIGDFGLIGCRCAKRWASTGGRRAKCGVDDRCRVWKHQCRPVDTGLVDALFLGSTRDTTTKWLRVWVVDQQNRHFLGSTSDIEAVTTHTKVSMSRVDEQNPSLSGRNTTVIAASAAIVRLRKDARSATTPRQRLPSTHSFNLPRYLRYLPYL